jgi:hypothetical protein
MPKKVLFIVSNAFAIGPRNRRTGNFLPEVAHPYAELDRAGCGIDFASLTGDTPFLDALNLADDPDRLAQQQVVIHVGRGDHRPQRAALMRCMTPPWHQRWNQSWTVLLGPNLRGSLSHWQPERMRKMMPLRALRQSAWWRPVRLVGQKSWRMGRTRSQDLRQRHTAARKERSKGRDLRARPFGRGAGAARVGGDD